MNLIRFWMSATSGGSVVWRSLTRAPASSIRSMALSGRKRSGMKRRGGVDGRLDRFVGIRDGVELLVALLDAEQDPDGVRFVRRRNLDGLEAAFERTVLLDRFAVLAGRRRADALDLAARQRRLQNVGGVERTFGRTCADQRVQLVDEDDGVLILHQLLHDGLQPLFELAAILRAGDDQRKIERQNALVGQERRHVAVGDALRQTLRRWRSCRRRARRSAPDCSWCAGRESE